MNERGPLGDLMPSDPIMIAAWLGCLRYSLGRPDILDDFRKDTGNNWTPGKSGLDQMIDRATGAELEFFRSFAKWHNENIWGEVDGKAYDSEPRES